MWFSCIFLGMALLMAAPNVSAQSGECPEPSVPLNALMLVPRDFEGFTYASLLGRKETVHKLGEEALEELRAKLNPVFQYLTMKPVSSEAAAKEMLKASTDPELEQFDLFLIPHFRSVSYWVKGQHYGFEIDLVMDVYPYDMSKVTMIRGYGESRTGFYAGSSPGESASLALRKAAEAVQDGLCGGQRFLLP